MHPCHQKIRGLHSFESNTVSKAAFRQQAAQRRAHDLGCTLWDTKEQKRRGNGSYPGFVVVPPQQLISWRCTGQNRLLPNLPLPAEVLKHAVKSGTLPSVASATYTPLHYNPLSGDPQKGTPNCWKSPCRVLITAASQDFSSHFSH